MQRKRKINVVSIWIIIIFTIIAVTLVSMFVMVYRSILQSEARSTLREQVEVLRDNSDRQVVDVIQNQAARRLATKDAATGYIANIAAGNMPDTVMIRELAQYCTAVKATVEGCEKLELYFPALDMAIGSQGVQFFTDRKYTISNPAQDYMRNMYPADQVWIKRKVVETANEVSYVTYLRSYPGVFAAGQEPMIAVSVEETELVKMMRNSMRALASDDLLMLVDASGMIWGTDGDAALVGSSLPSVELNSQTVTLNSGATGMLVETGSNAGAWHYALFRPSASGIRGYESLVRVWAVVCVCMLVSGLALVLWVMMKHYGKPMQRLIHSLYSGHQPENGKAISSPVDHFMQIETALSDMNKLKQERERFMTHNQPLLRQAWLNCFVHGEAYYTATQSQLGIDFPYPYFQVMIASAEPSEAEMTCIHQVFEDQEYVLEIFESREKESVFLFNHPFEEGILSSMLVEAGNRLAEMHSELTLGVGVWCKSEEQVPASFRCARRSFAIRYFEKDKRVCLFDPAVHFAEPESALNEIIVQLTELTKTIQREPQEKVEQSIDSIIGQLKEMAPYMDTMRSIMLITAMRLSKAVYDMKGSPEEVYSDNLLNAYYHIGGIGEFSQRLKQDCELFRRFLSRESSSANRSVVQYAIHHIRNTEPAELSTHSIAEAIGISTGHLSRMFHQETGRKLVDYLQEVRMEHAARLIAEGELTNEEICGKIGYSRPQYFATKFKEHYGVTINEYRLKVRQE